jgi:hypothetical protein
MSKEEEETIEKKLLENNEENKIQEGYLQVYTGFFSRCREYHVTYLKNYLVCKLTPDVK